MAEHMLRDHKNMKEHVEAAKPERTTLTQDYEATHTPEENKFRREDIQKHHHFWQNDLLETEAFNRRQMERREKRK